MEKIDYFQCQCHCHWYLFSLKRCCNAIAINETKLTDKCPYFREQDTHTKHQNGQYHLLPKD